MTLHALPPRKPDHGLADRAEADLRFIRLTMARSGRFTALSGPGIVVMGVVGLAAAGAATLVPGLSAWLAVWFGAAAVAVAAGIVGLFRKARQEGKGALAGPGRRFLMGFLPPVVAGAGLTAALVTAGATELLPGAWLLLYGAGVVAGGQASVRLVPLTGTAFMLTGVLAFLLPSAWGNACLALGFGLLHVVAGILIWRRHGG